MQTIKSVIDNAVRPKASRARCTKCSWAKFNMLLFLFVFVILFFKFECAAYSIIFF